MEFTERELGKLHSAIRISLMAHHNQFDKGGMPYFLHPLAVMLNSETINQKIVAILHDVIEDTHITLENLKHIGFEKIIVDAVDSISRRDDEKYKDYIDRCKQNNIARYVKILDLKHNLSEERMSRIDKEKRDKLINRYKKALEILENYG